MAMPNNRVENAMILAAGEGTRLWPLTLDTPKPLLPVGGVPLISRVVAWLKRSGVSQVVINLHHLGEMIEESLGDGSDLGLEVIYSKEERLLGTAGGVKRVSDQFKETFVVVYGDVLTDLDLGSMVEFHHRSGAMATIALQDISDPTGKGVVDVDGQGRILSFVEKPVLDPGSQCLINAGVYVLEPEILDHIAPGLSDFGKDVFPTLLETGFPAYGWRLRPWEYLIDIGTPEAYQQVNHDWMNEKINVA